jgi:transposase
VGRGTSYPLELRELAVRMVAEVRPEYPSDWPAICAVASRLGIGSAETLRKWVRQAVVDAGARAVCLVMSLLSCASCGQRSGSYAARMRSSRRRRLSPRRSSTAHRGPREVH